MRALDILRGIKLEMTKKDILALVDLATVELELLDIHQVQNRLGGGLGGKIQNLRKRAINNNIGHKVGGMGRVYTPADVEMLRKILTATERPATVKLRQEIVRLKANGMTNRAIAKKLNVDASYVTKLIKG